MEAELAIKTVSADLRRHLEKQHARKTASMGMGGVVITRTLNVEPKIDQSQAVTPWGPWASALGGLLIDDMADPTLAARENDVLTQALHHGVVGGKLSLLGQLTSKLARGIRALLRGSCHLPGQRLQSLQQTRREVAVQHVTGKEREHLHIWSWL
jgi:hypothetical protein